MTLQLEEKNSRSLSSVELWLIPEDSVDMMWPVLEPLLAKATARTPKVDTESILYEAGVGICQLWVFFDKEEQECLAAFVTSIHLYPSNYKTIKILCLGGKDMHRWKHLISGIEEWGVKEGCTAVEIVGRPGWGKIYPDYVETERTFSKEIGR